MENDEINKVIQRLKREKMFMNFQNEDLILYYQEFNKFSEDGYLN